MMELVHFEYCLWSLLYNIYVNEHYDLCKSIQYIYTLLLLWINLIRLDISKQSTASITKLMRNAFEWASFTLNSVQIYLIKLTHSVLK